MRVVIKPSVAKGTLKAPPSKSMAHRALIAAALAKGESRLFPIARSEDMLATMDCLRELGADFTVENDAVTVRSSGNLHHRGGVLNCRESGSTLRFLLPLCLLTGERITLCGSPRLMERPLSVYERLCEENGFLFERGEGSITVQGRLRAGEYRVAGNISSQFITGLLFALSTLPEESLLIPEGKRESASYVDMTLRAMAFFGAEVTEEAFGYRIHPAKGYCAREYEVEGDYSNAAFSEAFNLLGGEVRVEGLREDSVQGDRVYRKFFPLLKEGSPTLDLSDCPDLAPILFALASVFHGAVFTGTARLRMKESDRGEAMAEELAKCGGKLDVEENRIVVHPSKLCRPRVSIRSHNDHRIVMAMSTVLSLVGGKIEGAEAVKKSYPDYFETIRDLGILVEKDEAE